jgi:hypothetical protein
MSRGVIARAVRLAQATSSTTSVVLLVAFNLIPLAGVLFWGWNVATLLVLYWVENGIVGLLNVPKMLFASGPDEPATRVVSLRGAGPTTAGASDMTAKAALVPFFLVHYGIFWIGHGIFVFAIPQLVGAFRPISDPNVFAPGIDPQAFGPVLVQTNAVGPDLSAVGFAAIGLAISHTASFLINYVGRGEYRRVSVARQMFAPYGRLVILHLTILFGAFLSLMVGSPIGAIVVLVILKTSVDLWFHNREHAAIQARPEPSPSPGSAPEL